MLSFLFKGFSATCAGLALLFSASLSTSAQQAQITISPIELAPEISRLPEVAWIKPEDAQWKTGQPQFQFSSPNSGAKAEGWTAITNTHFLLAVTTFDAEHLQTRTGNDIWDGDALQIGFDGRGDGSGTMPSNTRRVFGADDLAFALALTPSGPQGWIWHGPKELIGKMPKDWVEVTRDEQNKKTNYRVRIPFAAIETRPGVFPTIGLALQVNNHSAASKKEEFYFGDGAGGTPAPGLFKKFRVGTPPSEYFNSATVTDEMWQKGQPVSIQVAVASGKKLTLLAGSGNQKSEIKLGGASKSIQRYLISMSAKDYRNIAPLKVTLQESGSRSVLLNQSLSATIPELTYEKLQMKLDELLTRSGEPSLFMTHLRSVKALTQSEWAKVTNQLPQNLPYARETLGYLSEILRGLEGDASNWQTYQDGKRALFISYLSKRDGTLQFYTFMLPKDWDPEKKYPLFLELHGAGSPHALNPIAAHLGYGKTKLDLAGYSTPRTYAMLVRSGFYMMPFGRGNTSYEDIGETDVWEAYNHLKSQFNVDADRQYLYGFSMGGAGTWVLGSRTPDLWAAMAILGVGRSAQDDVTPGIGRNVSNMPMFIWCGEQDIEERRKLSEKIRDEVTAYGNKPQFKMEPNVGHNYTGEAQSSSFNWMQQHVRKRPLEFSYMSDTKEHTGAWGINMERDLTMSGLPSFSYKIKGQAVWVETKGTPRVEIDLGPAGLQMSGSTEVYLNGKKSYEGPAKKINLPVVVAAETKK